MKTNELSALTEVRIYAAQYGIELNSYARAYYTHLLADTSKSTVITITRTCVKDHEMPKQGLQDAFFRMIASYTHNGVALYVKNGRVILLDKSGLKTLARDLDVARYTNVNDTLTQFIQAQDDDLKAYIEECRSRRIQREADRMHFDGRGKRIRKRYCSMIPWSLLR
jgi:hypothetical protein